MMRPSLAAGVVGCWLLSAAGCAVTRTLVAEPGDYADYRATRVAPTTSERVAAGQRYLAQHPHGAFREEVRAWFDEAEPAFYAKSQRTQAGLQVYLGALPQGPHAAEAEQRLAAFKEEARARTGEHLAARGAVFERELDAARQGRQAVLDAYAAWLRHLVELPWGQTTDQASGEFIAAFRVDPPRGRCEDDVCSKIVSMPYTVREGGAAETFVAVMQVTIHLAHGRIVEADLSGPELFSRLFEASQARPLALANAMGRVDAIAWAVDLTAGVLEARLPAARCARDVVAPVVLSRACDGFSAELVAADRVGSDDRIVLRGPALSVAP